MALTNNYTPQFSMPSIGSGTPVYNGPVYQQQPQVNAGPAIMWVKGEQEARNYRVLPGNSALLMDMENLVLYSKSTDISGQPFPMEIYDLVKREPEVQESQPAELSGYVKKDELEGIVAAAVEKALKSNRKPPYKKQAREGSSNG